MNLVNVLLENKLRTVALRLSAQSAAKKTTQKSHFCAQKSHFPLASTVYGPLHPAPTASRVHQDPPDTHSSLIDQGQCQWIVLSVPGAGKPRIVVTEHRAGLPLFA